jgi:hypothetical protein
MKNSIACTIFGFAILTFSHKSFSQNNYIKLILSSKEISNTKSDTSIKSIEKSALSDSIIVEYRNGSKNIYAPENIWGYESKGGITYRYYKGKFMTVNQLDSLTIYSKIVSQVKSNPVARISYTYYYFSKTPDSEILNLDKKTIKNQFSDNQCFLNKVSSGFKWLEDYSTYDKARKSYKIVEFYKECLNISQQ